MRELPDHVDRAVIEIDLFPPKTREFAEAQAGARCGAHYQRGHLISASRDCCDLKPGKGADFDLVFRFAHILTGVRWYPAVSSRMLKQRTQQLNSVEHGFRAVAGAKQLLLPGSNMFRAYA
ncbi:MAG TPA: hypothetical protein VGI65_10940 [Steroidobacteraceae bacterium]